MTSDLFGVKRDVASVLACTIMTSQVRAGAVAAHASRRRTRRIEHVTAALPDRVFAFDEPARGRTAYQMAAH
ncbi:hypothetical protein [Micromonospora inositola]|uniref:hypothetical protein n=1 Tax=Micromonospora inositola TaxID=47865 RepID=UPI0012FD113C|nr:hypothetical protein [Micromonospora inositola]